MTDYNFMLAIAFNIVLMAFVAFLAYFVTPWAMLGLFCLMGYKSDDEITVETANGSRVELTTSELTESDVRRIIEQTEREL